MNANANAGFDLQQLAALFAYLEPALASHLANGATFGVRAWCAIDGAKAHGRAGRAIAMKTLMIGRIPVDGYRTAHKSVVSLPEGRCRREADMPRSRRMLTLFFAAVDYPIVKRRATFGASRWR